MRAAPFIARLPTNLPGISFTASGRIWFKRLPSGTDSVMPVNKAKAAVLANVYSAASAKTRCFPPEAFFQAEQAVAVILASWQPLEQNSPSASGHD